MQLKSGEIVSLIGPNGAGKTTLIRAVLGLIAINSGDLWKRHNLRIGYMPQKLHIDATLPLTVQRFLCLVPKVKKDNARKALQEVNAEYLLLTPLQRISGGELQRVLLARALLRKPELLVLDEPAQGVDVMGQTELYKLISKIRDEHNCGVLMVSHDLHLVMDTTDTVICLNQHICCSGHPKQINNNPIFLELFGQDAKNFAVYPHSHNHIHASTVKNTYPAADNSQ
ncbi:UNVERIFIED_CONTAM: hypothetical protein GTU68_046826 [Idotea baltica]|nr:hypothetical protein [Idotea baltica]